MEYGLIESTKDRALLPRAPVDHGQMRGCGGKTTEALS